MVPPELRPFPLQILTENPDLVRQRLREGRIDALEGATMSSPTSMCFTR